MTEIKPYFFLKSEVRTKLILSHKFQKKTYFLLTHSDVCFKYSNSKYRKITLTFMKCTFIFYKILCR